jgi:UDP-3-O-[3-hydroxymyristoyl] N-acetylglucosamine deacetylase
MNGSAWNDYSTYRVQKTIRRPVTVTGIGLHSGQSTRLQILPAETGHGIVFEKIGSRKKFELGAHFKNVVSTSLATSLSIAGEPDSGVATVEHLMSAFYALGITNARVIVEGNEVPILDGSARPFVEAILDGTLELQAMTAPSIRVIKPIRIFQEGVVCELLPRDNLRLTTSIDFDHPAIGAQTFALELTPQSFIDEVSSSRTFGFMKDVDALRARNLAQGASLDNVLAFDEKGIVNKEGARFADECVRHKLLDALGDLALAGARIQGELVSFRGGHSIHIKLLQEVAKMKGSWEWLEAEPVMPTWQPESAEQAYLISR